MEGGSQAQDHGRAVCAKIRYSVSSTFATGCGFNKEILQEAICNDEFSGNNVVTMLRQLKTFSEHFYNTQNRACESPRAVSPLVCDPFLPLSLYVTCRKGGTIHVF